MSVKSNEHETWLKAQQLFLPVLGRYLYQFTRNLSILSSIGEAIKYVRQYREIIVNCHVFDKHTARLSSSSLSVANLSAKMYEVIGQSKNIAISQNTVSYLHCIQSVQRQIERYYYGLLRAQWVVSNGLNYKTHHSIY